MSPPSRRRGLKCLLCIAAINPYMVASFAEAWIEMTILSNHNQEALIVASFAEAWIEILIQGLGGDTAKSPPSRRRGLKLRISTCGWHRRLLVASFAEAWIEILHCSSFLTTTSRSPPSRRRGLKSRVPLPEEKRQ